MTAQIADLFPDSSLSLQERGIEAFYEKYWTGPVAGVDEAGRGPWAGPVVTAAVILSSHPLPPDVDDSKKLSKKMREELFEEIIVRHDVAIATAPVQWIDGLNIRSATLWAMARAVHALARRPAGVLIDGRDVPPAFLEQGLPAVAIVKGDSRVAAIAAASIVAKVVRDRMMRQAARDDPRYGFDRHMGYGTPEHRTALIAHGPSALHRRSFRPVRVVSLVEGGHGLP